MRRIITGILYIAIDFSNPLNKIEFRIAAILFLLGFVLLTIEIVTNWPSNNTIECGTRTFIICMLVSPYIYLKGEEC